MNYMVGGKYFFLFSNSSSNYFNFKKKFGGRGECFTTNRYFNWI